MKLRTYATGALLLMLAGCQFGSGSGAPGGELASAEVALPDTLAPSGDEATPAAFPDEAGLAPPIPVPDETTTTAPSPEVTINTRLLPPTPAAPPASAAPLLPPLPPVSGRTLRVASGTSGGDGSAGQPFGTIGAALAAAQPGDQVLVGAGTYQEKVETQRSGRADAPIRIIGDGAHVVGEGFDGGRLVQINHSYVTFERFEVSNADKLIWVQGATGVRLLNNVLHDAGGECMRIKYRSAANEVAGNRIDRCGGRGFDVAAGKKNGEGIYIGTAPEQLSRNPTPVPDASDGNWIHDNVISARAECVDVKESAAGNVVERNTCSGSEDPEGAGFSSRGRGTIFSHNSATGGAGAGIRLGGDAESDGILSIVRANVLTHNQGYGVKVQREPQTLVCGNDTAANGAGSTNGGTNPSTPC